MVANIALSLGMDVYGYDPFLSVDAALRLDRHIHVVKDINELYKRADYITIHIHYTKDTERMIDAKAIGAMKRGVRFINLARGEIVDDDAMLAALDTGWVAAYVTDFPNNRLVGAPHVLAMPHLGASTPESEQNCAVMAVDQLREQELAQTRKQADTILAQAYAATQQEHDAMLAKASKELTGWWSPRRSGSPEEPGGPLRAILGSGGKGGSGWTATRRKLRKKPCCAAPPPPPPPAGSAWSGSSPGSTGMT